MTANVYQQLFTGMLLFAAFGLVIKQAQGLDDDAPIGFFICFAAIQSTLIGAAVFVTWNALGEL